MRLFVAVRPPDDVLDALDALHRSHDGPARWTTRDQWHVTLRFLGNVDDPEPVAAALRFALRDALACDVRVGPRAGVLGRQVVYLPVVGIDELAAVVIDATRDFGEPPQARRFRGHLTLARTKGGIVDTVALALEREWTVREVELVRSHLGRGGARYEALETFVLRGR